MPNRRIPPETLEQVSRLSAEGRSQREIARLVGIDRGTVVRLLREQQPGPTTTAPKPGSLETRPVSKWEPPLMVKTTRDLVNLRDAELKELRLQELKGEMIPNSLVSEMFGEVSNWINDSYGSRFLRWLETLGVDYSEAEGYVIEQERLLVDRINGMMATYRIGGGKNDAG